VYIMTAKAQVLRLINEYAARGLFDPALPIIQALDRKIHVPSIAVLLTALLTSGRRYLMMPQIRSTLLSAICANGPADNRMA